jgi:hypothetical protein
MRWFFQVLCCPSGRRSLTHCAVMVPMRVRCCLSHLLPAVAAGLPNGLVSGLLEPRLQGSHWIASAIHARMQISKVGVTQAVLRHFPASYWRALFGAFDPKVVSAERSSCCLTDRISLICSGLPAAHQINMSYWLAVCPQL